MGQPELLWKSVPAPPQAPGKSFLLITDLNLPLINLQLGTLSCGGAAMGTGCNPSTTEKTFKFLNSSPPARSRDILNRTRPAEPCPAASSRDVPQEWGGRRELEPCSHPLGLGLLLLPPWALLGARGVFQELRGWSSWEDQNQMIKFGDHVSIAACRLVRTQLQSLNTKREGKNTKIPFFPQGKAE